MNTEENYRLIKPKWRGIVAAILMWSLVFGIIGLILTVFLPIPLYKVFITVFALTGGLIGYKHDIYKEDRNHMTSIIGTYSEEGVINVTEGHYWTRFFFHKPNERYDLTERTISLSIENVVSADNANFNFKSNIRYRIQDALKLEINAGSDDFETILSEKVRDIVEGDAKSIKLGVLETDKPKLKYEVSDDSRDLLIQFFEERGCVIDGIDALEINPSKIIDDARQRELERKLVARGEKITTEERAILRIVEYIDLISSKTKKSLSDLETLVKGNLIRAGRKIEHIDKKDFYQMLKIEAESYIDIPDTKEKQEFIDKNMEKARNNVNLDLGLVKENTQIVKGFENSGVQPRYDVNSNNN